MSEALQSNEVSGSFESFIAFFDEYKAKKLSLELALYYKLVREAGRISLYPQWAQDLVTDNSSISLLKQSVQSLKEELSSILHLRTIDVFDDLTPLFEAVIAAKKEKSLAGDGKIDSLKGSQPKTFVSLVTPRSIEDCQQELVKFISMTELPMSVDIEAAGTRWVFAGNDMSVRSE